MGTSKRCTLQSETPSRPKICSSQWPWILDPISGGHHLRVPLLRTTKEFAERNFGYQGISGDAIMKGMQNRRFTTESAAPRSCNFKVVVAFDDSATSSPALKTCEYVIQQLGNDIQVRRK